ncbi:unnamed protein product [Brassica oleracea]|nr:unnamed protein product [Brassica oleracea]
MHGYGMGPGSEWSTENWPRSPGEPIRGTIERADQKHDRARLASWPVSRPSSPASRPATRPCSPATQPATRPCSPGGLARVTAVLAGDPFRFLRTLDFVNFLLTAAAQESKMCETSEVCWGLLVRRSGIVWRGVPVGEHDVSIMVVVIHPQIFDNEFGFDARVLNNQPSNIPSEYVWSDEDKPSTDIKELQVPILDISSFLSGQDNHVATSQAARLVSEAAKLHGFFLVTNHGVQEGILARAYKCMGTFFDFPASEKQKAKRKWGEISGYADSFAGRFYSELPWKETLTFRFSAEEKLRSSTETVFVENQWRSIAPKPQSFVVNIGDTFMALTNGIYRSCLHRAVVNKERERMSLAFFLCPQMDEVVKPPKELLEVSGQRLYPNFTWSMFLEFTQKHYRSDKNTLQKFSDWLRSKEVIDNKLAGQS